MNLFFWIGIIYGVQLLESMLAHPEEHAIEWTVWKNAVRETVDQYMCSSNLDWEGELPKWSE